MINLVCLTSTISHHRYKAKEVHY